MSLNRRFLFLLHPHCIFAFNLIYFYILSLVEFNFHIMMMKFLGNWVKSVHTHNKHCFNKNKLCLFFFISLLFSLLSNAFSSYFPSLLLICMICLRSKSEILFYLFQLNYFSEVCYAKEEV